MSPKWANFFLQLAVEYESNAMIVKVDTDDEYEFARDMQVTCSSVLTDNLVAQMEEISFFFYSVQLSKTYFCLKMYYWD